MVAGDGTCSLPFSELGPVLPWLYLLILLNRYNSGFDPHCVHSLCCIVFKIECQTQSLLIHNSAKLTCRSSCYTVVSKVNRSTIQLFLVVHVFIMQNIHAWNVIFKTRHCMMVTCKSLHAYVCVYCMLHLSRRWYEMIIIIYPIFRMLVQVQYMYGKT